MDSKTVVETDWKSHTFKALEKQIKLPDQMEQWKNSQAYIDLMNFICKLQ